MKNAIIYWFVFLALQVVAGGIVQAVYWLWKGPGTVLDATGTILTMTLFGVATIALFLWQKWAVVSRHWIQTRPWVVLVWCVLAALGTIIPSGWLQELMPELPNLVVFQPECTKPERVNVLLLKYIPSFSSLDCAAGALLPPFAL